MKAWDVNWAALVGIEDLGPAVAGDRLLQRLDAEVGFHRDRYPPGQDLPAEPVDDRHEINEALRHQNVAGHLEKPVAPEGLK